MHRLIFALLVVAACNQDTGVKAFDASPAATISSHEDGDTVDAEVPITFRGSVSDPDNVAGTLLATWYLGDEVACSEAAPDDAGRTTCEINLPEGEQTVLLEVRDPRDASDTARVTLDATLEPVDNTAPTCTITAPEDGGESAPGDTVDFAGVVADGESSADALTVRWTSDLDGTLNTDASDSDGDLLFSTADLSEGDHTITLLVSDPLGESCSDVVHWTVGEGPRVSIENPTDGDRYNEGDEILFVATVDSATTTLTDLELVWSSDLDGELNDSPAQTDGIAGFNMDDLSWGVHEITLTVTDDLGLTAEDSISLVINGLPSAPEVSITPDPASPSESLTAVIDTPSVDPEGGAVSYTYAWTRDGDATAYDTDTVPSSATADGETWTVTVTPDDGEASGPAGTASVTIGNTAPVLSDVTLSPDPAYEGDTLTCTPGTATDVDGDDVSYAYAWEVRGSLISPATSTLSSTYFDKGDTVVCVVTPTDGISDGAAVDSNTVTIGDTAPVLGSVTLTPDPAYEGDTLTCTPGTATDADGDSVSYTYAWTVDGASTSRTSSTLSSTYFDKGDTVVCTVTPTDGTLSGAAVSSSTLTISNTAPTVSGVSISPSSPTASSTLTCSWSFSDADGDSDLSAVAWTIGSTTVGTGTTLAGVFYGGDTVKCTVTPYDGDDTGTASSKSVTIGNSAPVLSSVSLTPTTAYEGDTLTCTPGTATDADGDTISYSYAWTIGGASIGATSSTLSSSYFARGDVVRCIVTPSDGTDSGTAVSSSSVTISNSLPTITSLSISPSSPKTDSTLSAVVSSSDADGDSVTYAYAWTRGSTTLGTSSTLSGSAFSKGDSVKLTVTPSDGIGSGSSSSSTVTILDTAPGAPSVDITPSAPSAGTDDLLCYVVTDSTDADGDTITYSVSWEADGLPYPSGYSGATGPDTTEWTDDTVPAADTDLATTWTCTVTPDDGESEGTDASTSVDVLDLYHIGNDTALSSKGTVSAGYLAGVPFTVSKATTLYKLGVVMNFGGASVQLGVYTSSGGAPGTLVAETSSATTSTGDNEFDVTSPATLSAGTYYIMGLYGTTAYPWYTTSTTKTMYYRTATPGSSLPSSFGTGTSYCCQDYSYYLVVSD